MRSSRAVIGFCFSVIVIVWNACPAQAQFGAALSGGGPVNRSMAGASVAAPIDATGALFWNPAAISALPGSSVDFGLELLMPHTRLSSSLPESAFGPGIPPVPLAGESDADNGIFPLPTVGLVYKPECSPWTLGLGVLPIGGFGVNYAASNTNPILTPQPPNGFGLGAIYSEVQVLQIAPTIAYQLTDCVAVGFGPTLCLTRLQVDPLLVASQNANGTYPLGGNHTRMHWGGGVQAGAYATLDGGWRVGASVKSPQWFERFQFQTVDEFGRPRGDSYKATFPLIASVGFAYAGIERLLLAADFRYIDYANADGFKQQGFDATGAVRGLGFDSIFAVAVGCQYQCSECTSVRVGYSYNQNPISDSQSIFNVASPTIVEHTVYAGASYRVSSALIFSVAYVHAFENSIEGPIQIPLGTIPVSSVKNTTSADVLLFGATVEFGGGECVLR
jgi:long-chain fatty acid transport protein